MTFSECKFLIRKDLDRLSPKKRLRYVRYLITNASFKITFWFRLSSYLKSKTGFFYKILYCIIIMIYKHYQYLTGIQLSVDSKVGGGLCFAHFSCIIIAGDSVIGKNCTIFHGVTIGSVRGPKGGAPKIGDNVVLSAGVQVIGNVKIGNNVIVGAGAVVVHDIPDNSVVVGNPAKIVSNNGKINVSYYVNVD